MKNHRLTLIIMALLIMLPAGSAAMAAEPFHLGVALGISGTGAPYSKEATEAIQLAVDEINTQGGFLGQHPIKLFMKDTQTRPDIAKRVVLSA